MIKKGKDSFKERILKHIFIWDFWLSHVPTFVIIVSSIIILCNTSTIEISVSKYNEPLTLEYFEKLRNLVILMVSIVVSFVIFILRSLYNRRKSFEKTYYNTDELKSLLKNKVVAAKNYFITRAELKDRESTKKIIDSKPKTLKYSGGHLNSIISMMSDEDFLNYLKNNNVNVQFIFPDPNDDSVITDFVNNIIAADPDQDNNTYKEQINQSITQIKKIINCKTNPKAKIRYKLCNFAPSFGLQIIESDNNERLYVELYTINTENEQRLICPIEEQNSSDLYLIFYIQFKKLWDKSVFPCEFKEQWKKEEEEEKRKREKRRKN